MIFFAFDTTEIMNLDAKRFRSKQEYYKKIMESKYGYKDIIKSNQLFIDEWDKMLDDLESNANDTKKKYKRNS